MAEVRYENVFLEKILDFSEMNTNGSWFTKTTINNNKGNIPVYGASLNEEDVSYGYVKDDLVIESKGLKRKVRYFEDCLTWNIDGSIGLFYRKGRFSLSEKVIPLIIKNEYESSIDKDFLRFSIIGKSKEKNFGFSNKPGKRKLKNISISIPVNEEGCFDLEKQKEIVKKYEILEAKKKELKEKIDYFKDVQVDFMTLEISKFKEYKVSEIFNTSLSDGKYTKSYTTKNIGKFPLYSGQTDGEYANINSYDYDGSYLTWAKVGLAGYIMHHDNEKFSITNNRGILLLKDKYSNLNLEFLKILLEPIFRKNIKGRLGTREKNEYTILSKEMILNIKDKLIIPINNDGTFDIEKQNKIVRKYKFIEEMKKSILEKGLPFTLSNVKFDGETPYIYIYIRVSELFEIQRGKSIYTKTYCKNNNGECPVYSADNKNPLGYRNNYDYKGKFLTSSMNGIAGVLTILDEKFSVNADRVVFVPKVKEISLEYIKNILEPILRNKTKGRKGLKGKNEFTKLTPSMIEGCIIPIPYSENGEIFIKKLKEISKKYYTIEKIQKQLEVKIDELLRMEIKF